MRNFTTLVTYVLPFTLVEIFSEKKYASIITVGSIIFFIGVENYCVNLNVYLKAIALEVRKLHECSWFINLIFTWSKYFLKKAGELRKIAEFAPQNYLSNSTRNPPTVSKSNNLNSLAVKLHHSQIYLNFKDCLTRLCTMHANGHHLVRTNMCMSPPKSQSFFKI